MAFGAELATVRGFGPVCWLQDGIVDARKGAGDITTLRGRMACHSAKKKPSRAAAGFRAY
ncbi:hypothetical protein Tamer19_72170 [Cupriavidus sp. TA19]|nr:hypothetical protein Tamer19_72170 [Cupriavidus sp. TA19]